MCNTISFDKRLAGFIDDLDQAYRNDRASDVFLERDLDTMELAAYRIIALIEKQRLAQIEEQFS